MLRSLTSLALLAAVAAVPTPAKACSCILQPLAAARSAATVVFQGHLVRFETVADESFAVFRVRRVWKGELGRTVRVRAEAMTLCPPHLEVGAALIVYASGPPSRLQIEPCSRTAFSSSDAPGLGRSRPPRASREAGD